MSVKGTVSLTRRPLSDGFRHVALSAALVLAIAACGGGDAPADPEPGATPAAATPAPQPAAPVISAQIAAMSVDQLRGSARGAQAEQRMYAPAGDNAMEYYLALRDKQPNDAAVASALTDLMPYALIATEQSIARDDFTEAQRLYALMEKTDKSAPALPRLKQSIADGQTSLAQRQQQSEVDAEAEKLRLAKVEEDRRKQQQEDQRLAAQQLSQQQAAQQQAAQQAVAQREADQRAAEQRAAAQREAEQRAAAQREAEQRAAQAQSAAQPAAAADANDLRAISTPPPKYPLDAQRAGQSGEVIVEFTVATDGSVSAARVVRGNPPRVFDREAVAAVKRWRYQPVASPVTTRRTISFKP